MHQKSHMACQLWLERHIICQWLQLSYCWITELIASKPAQGGKGLLQIQQQHFMKIYGCIISMHASLQGDSRHYINGNTVLSDHFQSNKIICLSRKYKRTPVRSKTTWKCGCCIANKMEGFPGRGGMLILTGNRTLVPRYPSWDRGRILLDAVTCRASPCAKWAKKSEWK